MQSETTLQALPWGNVVRGARVHNVLTRLPGAAGDGAVLLVAHYDTVPVSPGAADDTAAVVALLQTLRELASGRPLRNDLIFLFSDAEEPGLMGARAFADHHPWFADVRLVLNFEARGVEGPSLMFETGPGTGRLVQRFARAAPHPVAASYSEDVYRFLPNDTDFSVFRDAGRPGFNFAFIGDSRRYHTRLDDAEALDPRSLAHHRSNALALARSLGQLDLATLTPSGPRVYFNLPVLGLVTYPAAWSPPLALLALTLVALLVGRRVRRGRFDRRLVYAAAALLGALAAAAAIVLLLDLLLLDLLALGESDLGDAGLYVWGEILVALGVATLACLWWTRRLGLAAVAAGFLVTWAVVAVATAFLLPSSSYLLLWPLLGAVGAAWAVETRRPRRGLCLALLVAALPLLLLWPPALHLVVEALGLGEGFVLATLAAAAVSLAIVPIACWLHHRAAQWTAAATTAIGFAIVGATALAGPDDARPQASSLLYLFDRSTDQAMWATLQVPVDAWAAGILGDRREERPVHSFLGGDAIATVAAAPRFDLPAPELEVLPPLSASDGRAGHSRRLRARSPRGAPVLRLELESEAPLVELRVAGRRAPITPDGEEGADWYLVFYGLPAEGLEIEATLAGPAPLSVTLLDQAYDLETLPGVAPRGPGAIPSRSVPTDLTIVRRRVEVLGAAPEVAPPTAPATAGD